MSSTSKFPPQGKRYLRKAAVKARYGGVSDMWIQRRLKPSQDPKDPDIPRFPEPYYFGPGNVLPHWDEDELDAYDRECARRFSGTRARRGT
jgi:hypothetical protein